MPPTTRCRHRAPLAGALVAAVLAALFAATPAAASGGAPSSSAERHLAALIDEYRTARGLAPLVHVADLHREARDWSSEMARRGGLAHDPDLGARSCCWERMSQNVGRASLPDGGVAQARARAVFEEFVRSAEHRDNLLGPEADQIGVGAQVARGQLWVTVHIRELDGSGGPSGGFRDPYTGAGVPPTTAEPLRPGVLPGPAFDEDPATTERHGPRGPVGAAVEISRLRFEPGAARHAVLAGLDVFAAALAGMPLTRHGPLLFTPSGDLPAATLGELRRVLPPGATVFVLGGTRTVGPAVTAALTGEGYRVTRLAGRTRVDTAVAIADAVVGINGRGATAALARGYGSGSTAWADSIGAGAWLASYEVPLLLTPTEVLPDRVDRWLDGAGVTRTVVLGGPDAVSEAAARRAPGPARVAGRTRAATAARLAERAWPSSRRFVVINGWDRGGWRYGLAAGALAGASNAPVLLVPGGGGEDLPAPTARTVSACRGPSIDLAVIGPRSRISDGMVRAMDARDGHC